MAQRNRAIALLSQAKTNILMTQSCGLTDASNEVLFGIAMMLQEEIEKIQVNKEN